VCFRSSFPGSDRGEVIWTNKKVCVVVALFFLTVFAVSSMIVRGASQVELTPTSGEPGDSIDVEGTGFAASKTVGVGWGPQVAAVNDPATVTQVGDLEFYGTTSQHPIKPGSFIWRYMYDAVELYVEDNGDGTIHDPAGGRVAVATINYTSGYFYCRMVSTTRTITSGTYSYTTYYFNSINSTFPIFPTDGSGTITGQITVPQIWNGTETVTVIDEAGNIATSDFTVEGSDIVPEALNVGAVVLLTSTAIAVSFYWLRKPSYTKKLT
jgi:hypothetical protein